MKVIRHTAEYCKIDSEIGCKVMQLFFEPAFAVIEIFAGTLIDPQQVGKADGFSDELYGNNPFRKDSPNISGVPKGHPLLGFDSEFDFAASHTLAFPAIFLVNCQPERQL